MVARAREESFGSKNKTTKTFYAAVKDKEGNRYNIERKYSSESEFRKTLSANGFRVVKHGYTAPNAKYRFGEV
jgi:hypothetical protein